MPLTQVSPGLLDSNAQYYGFKNRIINGGMGIFQRNTAATVSGNYCLDRWTLVKSNTASTTTTQVTDAPPGFQNSMRMTVSVADTSVGAAEYELLRQIIEGFNISDFAFGSASATPITLSFWVKSSVAGLYCGSLTNGYTEDRILPFSYTINSSNTWEFKSISLPGNTSATGTAWNVTNGPGLILNFYQQLGSNFTGGTAGVWGTAPNYGVTGGVNLLATVGNIFAITGVQLEKGSTATSFDYRPYTTELQLCQRYYARTFGYSGLTGSGAELSGTVYGSVQMRSVPTLTAVVQEGGPTGLNGLDQQNNNSNMICRWWVSSGAKGSPGYIVWNGTASAEL
jgi:hypothetical protein